MREDVPATLKIINPNSRAQCRAWPGNGYTKIAKIKFWCTNIENTEILDFFMPPLGMMEGLKKRNFRKWVMEENLDKMLSLQGKGG